MLIALISACLSVLCLVGLVLSITSGLVTAGVDGLFVVLVCLLMAVIFGLNALSTAASAGFPLPARFRKAHK